MPWDVTSTHSLEAWVEYQRKQLDALIVVVIRPGDGALAADPLIDVIDVHDRLWDGDLPKLLKRLREVQDEERERRGRREAKQRG